MRHVILAVALVLSAAPSMAQDMTARAAALASTTNDLLQALVAARAQTFTEQTLAESLIRDRDAFKKERDDLAARLKIATDKSSADAVSIDK